MFLGLDSTIVSIVEWLGTKGETLGKEVYFVKEWDPLRIGINGDNVYCNFHIESEINV